MKKTIFDTLSDEQVASLCVYGEARGEALEGQIAVASVILNRMKMSNKTAKLICLQPHQFSCFNPSDANYQVLTLIAKDWDKYIETNKYLRQAYWVATGVLGEWVLSNVANATHYHHIAVTPSWSSKLKKLNRIGNHQFYYEANWNWRK